MGIYRHRKCQCGKCRTCKTTAITKRWREKNPEKLKAQKIVQFAVQYGQMTKQPCEVCGAERVDAHHDDYSKPLKVRWLCRLHHAAVHKEAKRA